MTKKKIFVDLDRTILDTDVFFASVWHYLGEHYNVDVESEKQRAADFLTHNGNLYDYDFFRHLQSLELGEVSQLIFELTVYMQKQFLYFNDSEDGIAAINELGGATILTYGSEQYQRFKLACLPELAKFPVVIVQQHKKHYFAEHYQDPCVLVDDKNLSGDLPDNVDFIRIDRKQVRPVEQHEGYKSIRKLQNLKEAIEL